MPDQFGFNHLPDRGDIFVRCIQKECDFGGPIGRVNDKARAAHFLTHPIVVEGIGEHIRVGKTGESVFTISAENMRIQACRICGNDFAQIRRRGRPALECDECKEKNA